MRYFFYAASAALAMTIVVPAAFAETITTRIVSVDLQGRTVTLADKSVMIVGKDVALESVPVNEPVTIVAQMPGDNGFDPITKIVPAAK